MAWMSDAPDVLEHERFSFGFLDQSPEVFNKGPSLVGTSNGWSVRPLGPYARSPCTPIARLSAVIDPVGRLRKGLARRAAND
jgi:hypothetical protein